MDHPRCAQLQEGDVLLEVNGENVRNYAHNELVTVLKRCPKGNQATFVVLRQQNEVSTLSRLFACAVLWHQVYLVTDWQCTKIQPNFARFFCHL